jgi:hypothetical protein
MLPGAGSVRLAVAMGGSGWSLPDGEPESPAGLRQKGRHRKTCVSALLQLYTTTRGRRDRPRQAGSITATARRNSIPRIFTTIEFKACVSELISRCAQRKNLSSNGGRDTGFDLGRGLVSWPCIGQPLACPLVARCEPSRGSQVKAGVAPTTRDRRWRTADWDHIRAALLDQTQPQSALTSTSHTSNTHEPPTGAGSDSDAAGPTPTAS